MRTMFALITIPAMLASALACSSEPPSWSVTSVNNVVGREIIELESDRYSLRNIHCTLVELAEYPSGKLVESIPGSFGGGTTRGVNVEDGKYVLRAIGYDCKATLEQR